MANSHIVSSGVGMVNVWLLPRLLVEVPRLLSGGCWERKDGERRKRPPTQAENDAWGMDRGIEQLGLKIVRVLVLVSVCAQRALQLKLPFFLLHR